MRWLMLYTQQMRYIITRLWVRILGGSYLGNDDSRSRIWDLLGWQQCHS